MKLFIAEKPSLGKAISEVLGVEKARNGYIDCRDETCVTWVFGHMYEQFMPEDYDPALKSWKKESLPINPDKLGGWKLTPRTDAADQLKVIANLLRKADRVVHAGDPDREGQLLVDELLEEMAWTGPVDRIWLAALDHASVTKALDSMGDNSGYKQLCDAAKGRSRADWLIGINATRGMTCIGRAAGYADVLSLGRVQTPTLAMIVGRDQAVEAFQPQNYFVLEAVLENGGQSFRAVHHAGETQAGLDEEGRLVNQVVAREMAAKAAGPGRILSAERKEQRKAPPLPHSLSSLQKDASAKLGLGAQQVLELAQALYEKKLTTYPRTDCRYLPEEQFSDAGRILEMLQGLDQEWGNLPAAADGEIARKSSAWATAKVTAHHAIIPTGELPTGLKPDEQALYGMIALAYALQFQAEYRYESQKIRVMLDNLQPDEWHASGRYVIDPGWTAFTQLEESPEASLPDLREGMEVQCPKVEILAKKTRPPAKFTEGTLIDAMKGIHRFVDDAKAKALLKENAGLGTEATRAGVIETLKLRGFLKSDGKNLVSTALGRKLVELTPILLKDPVTTANWESRLADVEAGRETLQTFMDAQVAALPELVKAILEAEASMPIAHPCPQCGRAMRRLKGKEGHFWGCSGYQEGCTFTLPDTGGKPGKREIPRESSYKCPECGHGLRKIKGKNGWFWGCANRPECGATFPDKFNKPNLSARKAK